MKLELSMKALSNSNKELKKVEEIKEELIGLLETYDSKLDELNEQNEFKDL